MAVKYCLIVQFSVITAEPYCSIFLTATTGEDYAELNWTIHCLSRRPSIVFQLRVKKFRHSVIFLQHCDTVLQVDLHWVDIASPISSSLTEKTSLSLSQLPCFLFLLMCQTLKLKDQSFWQQHAGVLQRVFEVLPNYWCSCLQRQHTSPVLRWVTFQLFYFLARWLTTHNPNDLFLYTFLEIYNGYSC